MDRRTFLQMLGIGGAAQMLTPTVPLFSGRESALWTPEHTSLTASHLVLTRPAQTPWQRAATPLGADPRVLRVNRKSWPSVGGRQLHPVDDGGFWWDHVWVPPSDHPAVPPNVPGIQVVLRDSDDPHEAFYRAATWVRDAFAKQSQRRLLEVPQAERPAQQLVTLVDTPIFAGPEAVPEGHEGDRAFRIEISYTPHLVRTGEMEMNGWEIYSENGEYPIEIPKDIDFDRLLRVDRRVLTGETDASRMRGRLVLPLGGTA